LAYANQAKQDSKGIWDKTKNRNNADFSNLSVPLEHDNANSDSSDKYNNTTSHFTTIFTISIIVG